MSASKIFFAALIALSSYYLSQTIPKLYTRSDDYALASCATWGIGKYTIDLDVYHKEVKPQFITKFKAIPKFISLCGSNPDFEIDRKGNVNPNAVDKKLKQLGKCTKSAFTLDLGDLVLKYAPPKCHTSTTGKYSLGDEPLNDVRTGDSVLASCATWGIGKYTIDLDVYHKEVKPQFITKFKAIPKFISLCGSNPDFEIDRKGNVNPNAVDKKLKQLGKCTKSAFTLDLGDLVLKYTPPSCT